MATIETALFSELKTDSAIATKVGYATSKFHIYPIVVPETQLASGASYFLVYNKVTQRDDILLDIEIPLFQITIIADTYIKMKNLRDDVIRVLNRFKGSLGSTRSVMYVYKDGEGPESYNEDTSLYSIPVDFRIKFVGDNQ